MLWRLALRHWGLWLLELPLRLLLLELLWLLLELLLGRLSELLLLLLLLSKEAPDLVISEALLSQGVDILLCLTPQHWGERKWFEGQYKQPLYVRQLRFVIDTKAGSASTRNVHISPKPDITNLLVGEGESRIGSA